LTRKRLVLTVAVSCLVVVLALMAGGCAKTTSSQPGDQSWANVQQKGELVVGLCAQYAPFESINDNTKQIEGFDVDLANALGQVLGVKVKIVDAQWEALLGGVQKGDYDVLITCMSKKEASAGSVNMSDVYYQLPEIIVVNQDNDTIKSADDLKGKTVGVQTATSSEQAVDSLTGLKEVKRYDRNTDAFLDLRNKRVDAVIVGYAYAATELKNKGDVKIINTPVGEVSDVVMVLNKGADTLTAKLNEALATVKQNGAYDQAINKWLSV